MPIKTPRELFVHMLSDLRQGTERTTKLVQEFAQDVRDPDVKEALDARIFVSQKILGTINQVFKVTGEQPVKVSGHPFDAVAKEFRNELAEIQTPQVRDLYILAKANQALHLRLAEYRSLLAAADLSGHSAVGALLETCLADKLVFVERADRLLHHLIGSKMAKKSAARSVA